MSMALASLGSAAVVLGRGMSAGGEPLPSDLVTAHAMILAERIKGGLQLGLERTGECTSRPPLPRRATVMREAIEIRPRTLSGLVTAQSPSSKRSSIVAHLG